LFERTKIVFICTKVATRPQDVKGS